MQFSLMRFRKEQEIGELPLEIYAGLDGTPRDHLDESDHVESLVDLSRIVEGINGSLITIHIAGDVTTPLGQTGFLRYKIPVVLRKSSLALIGSDGENSIERAVIKLLSITLNLALEPLAPKKAAILEMFKCSRRVERPMIITEDRMLAVEEAIDFADEEVLLPSSSEPMSWIEIFSRYPLASANLIFKVGSKELLVRFFLDSIWLDDDIEPDSLEYLVNVLERFLLEERECDKHQGSPPESR